MHQVLVIFLKQLLISLAKCTNHRQKRIGFYCGKQQALQVKQHHIFPILECSGIVIGSMTFRRTVDCGGIYAAQCHLRRNLRDRCLSKSVIGVKRDVLGDLQGKQQRNSCDPEDDVFLFIADQNGTISAGALLQQRIEQACQIFHAVGISLQKCVYRLPCHTFSSNQRNRRQCCCTAIPIAFVLEKRIVTVKAGIIQNLPHAAYQRIDQLVSGTSLADDFPSQILSKNKDSGLLVGDLQLLIGKPLRMVLCNALRFLYNITIIVCDGIHFPYFGIGWNAVVSPVRHDLKFRRTVKVGCHAVRKRVEAPTTISAVIVFKTIRIDRLLHDSITPFTVHAYPS